MKHWLDKVVALLTAETSDLRELARIAGADPRRFYRGISVDELDTAGQDLSDMEFSPLSPTAQETDSQLTLDLDQTSTLNAALVTRELRSTSRQEERIAKILDILLSEPVVGRAVLESYTVDKATFATYAIRTIRERFSDRDQPFDQEFVASLVRQFFNYTFPMNRGRLLFYLAKYLSKYPIVNAAISANLKRTVSMFVDEYRNRIEQMLQRK